jgi:hypothetical protein
MVKVESDPRSSSQPQPPFKMRREGESWKTHHLHASDGKFKIIIRSNVVQHRPVSCMFSEREYRA